VALRVLQEARSRIAAVISAHAERAGVSAAPVLRTRHALERVDGPHCLLQVRPRECAQLISEFSARIGV